MSELGAGSPLSELGAGSALSELGAGFEQAAVRAADARAAIANIIDRVSSGELDLAGAFAAADADELTGRCFAVKVFESVPGIGKVRARRTMEEFGIDEGIWIRDVSVENRGQIRSAFRSSD